MKHEYMGSGNVKFTAKLNRRFDDGYPEWGIYHDGRRIALLTRSSLSDEIMVTFINRDFEFCSVYFRHFTMAGELNALLKAIAATC